MASLSDVVSMATKTKCPLTTADWLTRTPVPGAPDMYLHIVPLQMSSLIKRDRCWKSAARAALYRSRQTGVIGTEFTVTASTIVCFSGFSSRGLAADWCCATAEPKQYSNHCIVCIGDIFQQIRHKNSFMQRNRGLEFEINKSIKSPVNSFCSTSLLGLVDRAEHKEVKNS